MNYNRKLPAEGFMGDMALSEAYKLSSTSRATLPLFIRASEEKKYFF
jgi:hypothetical protein